MNAVPPHPTRSLAAVGQYFESLGRCVEDGWTSHRSNEEFFPTVASSALRNTPVPSDVDAVGILEFLTTRRRLVAQEGFGFGEPPVTLYRSRDFRISALYWLDGTTAIHQHNFSGAFRVLEGSSIHVEYGYERQETVTSRLLLGAIKSGRTEFLRQGDVREIVAGGSFIHALFHLDRPSVTIVIRTDRQAMSTPQYEYLQPGLACDPFFKDETIARQLSGIQAMYKFAPADAVRCAKAMISGSDYFAGFHVLQTWFGFDRSAHLDDLIDHFVRTHGSSAEVMRAVFEERKRQHGIIARRRLMVDPHHRLFLALVLNLPDRASMELILRQKFPDADPVDLLMAWIEELSSPALRGTSGLYLGTDDLPAIAAALRAGQQASGNGALARLSTQMANTPLLSALLR